MTTRRFCDYCDKQMMDVDLVQPRAVPAVVHGKELWVGFDVRTDAGGHIRGDVCCACLWAAIDYSDPRTRMSSAETKTNCKCLNPECPRYDEERLGVNGERCHPCMTPLTPFAPAAATPQDTKPSTEGKQDEQ